MDDRLTFVKWINGESRYFPENIYNTSISTENNEWTLRIEHKPTKTLSLICSMSQVLYVRFHMPKKEKEEILEN